jgi:hypothetical protein
VRTRIAAAVAVAGAVLALGVGAAGAGASSAPKHKKPSPSVPAAVSAQAKAALLTLANLPSGWEVDAPGAGPVRASPLSKGLASCVGAPKKVATVLPVTYSSPDFTNDQKTLAVEDSVAVYSSAAQAQAEYAALANTKTPTCMNSLGSSALHTSIQNEAGSGATVGTIAITALPKGSLEPGETGFEVTIPLSAQGKVLDITSIQVDFAKGKLTQQLTFNGNGTSFPPLQEVSIIEAAKAKT